MIPAVRLPASGGSKHLLLLGDEALQGSGPSGSCSLERRLRILKMAWTTLPAQWSGCMTRFDTGSSAVERIGQGPAAHWLLERTDLLALASRTSVGKGWPGSRGQNLDIPVLPAHFHPEPARG